MSLAFTGAHASHVMHTLISYWTLHGFPFPSMLTMTTHVQILNRCIFFYILQKISGLYRTLCLTSEELPNCFQMTLYRFAFTTAKHEGPTVHTLLAMPDVTLAILEGVGLHLKVAFTWFFPMASDTGHFLCMYLLVISISL